MRALPILFVTMAACKGGPPEPPPVDLSCQGRTLTAEVVALYTPIALNRLGSQVPGGLVFALRSDVVMDGAGTHLREGVRPRPLVLRAGEGQCLNVTLHNHLDEPVSLHIDGTQWRTGEADDGAELSPGESGTLSLLAEEQGSFLLYSRDDAQRSAGLFGALNVEPAGSEWYRSQVSAADLAAASTRGGDGHPVIDYDAVYPDDHPRAGQPILAMVDASGSLVHADLTAMITGPGRGMFANLDVHPAANVPGRRKPFREITTIYHDLGDVAQQAFAEVYAPLAAEGGDGGAQKAHAEALALAATLAEGADRYGINYASSGVSGQLIASRLGLSAVGQCGACRGEEFAFSSWASGDPGLLTSAPAWTPDGAAAGPVTDAVVPYPDDPANVFHSYLGDPVRFRVLYSGDESPVHFIQGHQWLDLPDDDSARYVDSQVLDDGAGFTMEVAHGGSGSSNHAIGDFLIHSLTPHQRRAGMWAVWRVHDVFESGSILDAAGHPVGRALPDGELSAGSPIPAVLPLPGAALAPLPGNVRIEGGQVTWDGIAQGGVPLGADQQPANPGYPFFIPGVAGSRAPQPPLELVDDGGLPRHVIDRTGSRVSGALSYQSLDRTTSVLSARALAADGEPVEKLAMAFHEAAEHATVTADGTEATFATNGHAPQAGAPYADPCSGAEDSERVYRAAYFQHDAVLDRSGLHSPQLRVAALWEDVAAVQSGASALQPLFLRAHSGDCVLLHYTNLTDRARTLDDFTPTLSTDIASMSAGLVKQDVTSSGGLAGGWNYEDGAYAPEEVTQRIKAINAARGMVMTDGRRRTLRASVHPYFRRVLGAQTVVQRWYVNPLPDGDGVDRTFGVAGISELFSPALSVGPIGGLIAEPADSVWWDPATGNRLAQRLSPDQERHPVSLRMDGGPTSWQARIERSEKPAEAYREFALAVHEGVPAYAAGLGYPAGRTPQVRYSPFQAGTAEENHAAAFSPSVSSSGTDCPTLGDGALSGPCPSFGGGLSAISYRSDVMSVRTSGEWDSGGALDPTDPANGYLSLKRTGYVGAPPYDTLSTQTPALAALRPAPRTREPKPVPVASLLPDGAISAEDPYTPVLRAYMGERVRLAVVSSTPAAVSIHGLRWSDSGWRERLVLGGGTTAEFAVPLAEEADRADHLYVVGDDAWGLLRAYSTEQAGLKPLSRAAVGSRPRIPTCPAGAATRTFDVHARSSGDRIYYALASEKLYTGALSAPPRELGGDLGSGGFLGELRPMVLRARAGECIRVTLRNRLDPATLPAGLSAQVGLRPQLLSYDVVDDSGFNAGSNPVQTVGPGEDIVYNWYAGLRSWEGGAVTDRAVELGAINLLPADPDQVSAGLFGALIIEPADAEWVVPMAGDRTNARVSSGSAVFQEFVLLYTPGEGCEAGVNYHASACEQAPWLLPALVGESLRIRLLHPGGDGGRSFALHGHIWQESPYTDRGLGQSRSSLSESVASNLGPGAHREILVTAGGALARTGTYPWSWGAVRGELRVFAEPAAE